jgi:hypothetical protein
MKMCVPQWLVLLALCTSTASAAEFSDDFEGYAVGTNPTNVYSFTSSNPWVPPGSFPGTDLFSVAFVNSNRVLQFQHGAPNVHFPVVLKTYNQEFKEVQRVGITYLWTRPSMGWTILDVDYRSETNYYRVFLDYRNKLFFMDSKWNVLSEFPLWPDKIIMDVSHRVEVARCCDSLTITVIRLDNMQSKSFAVAAPSQGGKVRFGFLEDVFGDVCFNADRFYVKGITAEESDGGWVKGEARFVLMNSPPLKGYRFVGTVRDKVWNKKKPGFVWLDCYIKE